jgi:cytidine deaminase
MTDEQLIDAARNMLQYSYSPYSHFRVGAALLSSDGRVFTGCNIENAAYGPSMCAERVAFFNAVSTGVRGFAAIAIVGGRDGVITDYCPPCGVCRQVMSEFCKGDFRIILTNGSGKVKVKTLDELLPERFSL